MSIQSEIDRIKGNVTDSLSAIRGTGVNVPDGSNSNDLPNLINDLANTRQRVVDLGVLTSQAIGDNYIEVALTPEQVTSIFYDELPPVIVFTSPEGDRISFSSPYSYSKTHSEAIYSLFGLTGANPENGFSGLIPGFLYINNLNLYYGQTVEFVVDYDSAIFAVPVQLPSDPTQPLEAATKRYIDNKTNDVLPVLNLDRDAQRIEDPEDWSISYVITDEMAEILYADESPKLLILYDNVWLPSFISLSQRRCLFRRISEHRDDTYTVSWGTLNAFMIEEKKGWQLNDVRLASEDYVKEQIGSINTLLDTINGEVV